mmetsp:Transcript_12554/g.27745  ORF Transcript_12554/g.27745 Transcript_12554/m.27745 type:complete len:96 (+) Transcript_12554:4566-4853(+)
MERLVLLVMIATETDTVTVDISVDDLMMVICVLVIVTVKVNGAIGGLDVKENVQKVAAVADTVTVKVTSVEGIGVGSANNMIRCFLIFDLLYCCL